VLNEEIAVLNNGLNKVDVAIVGGGIAGLTTAVALTQVGLDVHVYEQAPAYGEVGGHLTMDPAAVAVLARWGLDGPFKDISCELDGMEVKSLRTGQVLAAFPHPDIGALGVEDDDRKGTRILRSFLRTEFLGMLAMQLPAQNLHTGHRLVALESDGTGATIRFENGGSATASLVLGADGVRSLARRSFDDSLAVSANWSVLRTLCSADLLPDDMPNDRMRFWDGWEFGDKEAQIGAHLLTVPVREGKFVSIDLQFVGGDQLEGCDPLDLPIDRVMRRYPVTIDPVVSAMIDGRVEPITSHAIFDRPVADKWVEQRIAILGDAAHSMRPSMGQGACQSIHDAGELANAIALHGLTTEALLAFEAKRKPYVKMIVDVTRAQPVAPELKDCSEKNDD
jgi:salicylate hydroxylase